MNKKFMDKDPFDPNEMDFKKCNAIHSSLWELKILMNHTIPGVSSVTKLFKNTVTNAARPILTDFMGKTYDKIFSEEMIRKVKGGIPTNFIQPTSLFLSSDFPGWSFGDNS
jgi:U3 small nucleolar RNA-associated protein 19